MNISARLEKLVLTLKEFSNLCLLDNWRVENSVENELVSISKISDRQTIYFDTPEIHLKQIWKVPSLVKSLNIENATARLNLIWWADFAEVFVNSNKVAEGDLFDQKQRILLGENIQANQEFILEIKLRKPKHDRGALQKSEIILEYPHQPCDLGKLAQELEIIQVYLPILSKENYDLNFLETVLIELGTILENTINCEYLIEINRLRKLLLPIGEILKQRKIYILGNAHIDIAWLWTIAETKQVLQRTFTSVLNLQMQYPELIFNQSSALSYAWIETEYPDVFQRIKSAIANNQWELTGGMWVEPDCNIPSGESLIRQILYGKNYFLNKFNKDVKIAWLPDTFGFNWQLPQILLKSGFTAFITQKLTWNDTNKFPHQVFWWQGLDGSKIFTYFSNEIGLGIEPVAIAKFICNQEQRHHLQESLWLYGVGDHGGGPTADMLNIKREWENSDLFFTIEPSTAEEFINNLQQNLPDNIPTWQDELYLEFHRGTYTTKADQKSKNRQTETLLTNLEKYRTILSVLYQKEYPQAKLSQAWQGLLLNQFHDILPGTSICEVYTDSDRTWQEIEQVGQSIIIEFAQPQKIENYSASINLWNFLNWKRDWEIIELPLISHSNNALASKLANFESLFPTQTTSKKLLAVAESLPSLGYTELQLVELQDSYSISSLPPLIINNDTLENQYLKITIDLRSGEIAQIFDKRSGKLLLSKSSELQFYEDKGQYWDAWNIDPNYADKPLYSSTLESIVILESGPLRASFQINRRFNNSAWQQEIRLDAFHPYVTIKNLVDWQEEHVLVKVCFPLSYSANFTTYEIPMGTIQRCTLAETDLEKAKFEIPAQFWADLSAESMGLSVLNDCKYGYSTKPNEISLTLLRSPNWPCIGCDRGIHEFTYRLLPHQGDWREAGTVRCGYELNNPLASYPIIDPQLNNFSFLSVSSPNIMLSALKLAESSDSTWIVRFYEAHGRSQETTISLTKSLASVRECDLLEHPLQVISHQTNWFHTKFESYEIKTFMICFD